MFIFVQSRSSQHFSFQCCCSTPPPLQAETLSHGVVSMRCDITTCSSSHVSLLVSGSAQTCFDDQVSISTIMEHFLALSLYEKNHILPYDICSF